MATHGAGLLWPLLAIALIGGSLYINMAIARRRRDAMRAMAGRVGLQSWPGDHPPRGLSLNGTPFETWSKLSNIYEGLLNGREVVVLDFRKQARKSSWSRTIIAVKATDNPFPRKPLSLEVKQAGDWQIIYSPMGIFRAARLMDVGEVEDLIQLIGRK